jgi:hypothetical protein
VERCKKECEKLDLLALRISDFNRGCLYDVTTSPASRRLASAPLRRERGPSQFWDRLLGSDDQFDSLVL